MNNSKLRVSKKLIALLAAGGIAFAPVEGVLGEPKYVEGKFVKEIEALFMEETTKKHTLEDGRVLTTKGVYNKLVRTISAELNGRYYDIMYGKKRKESEDA